LLHAAAAPGAGPLGHGIADLRAAPARLNLSSDDLIGRFGLPAVVPDARAHIAARLGAALPPGVAAGAVPNAPVPAAIQGTGNAAELWCALCVINGLPGPLPLPSPTTIDLHEVRDAYWRVHVKLQREYTDVATCWLRRCGTIAIAAVPCASAHIAFGQSVQEAVDAAELAGQRPCRADHDRT
jgi:hypothetical protein